MTAPIRGSEPHDLIAYAWFVMGFRPRESLVVIGLGDTADVLETLVDEVDDGFDERFDDDPDELLSGAGRRHGGPPVPHGTLTTGAVARVDLPTVRTARAAADSVADLLETAGDDVCLLLVVSDAPGDGPLVDAEGGMAHERVADRVRGRLLARGIHVLDTLLVGPSTFRSYACDVTCCDRAGRSLDAVGTSAVAASMVLRGRTVLDSEQDLVADVDPARAAARGEPPLSAPARRPGRAALRTALRRWCADLDAGAQEPTRPQALLDALTDRDLRDAVLLTLVPDGRESAYDVLEGVLGADAQPLDLPPDDALADVGRRLLAVLARRAPAGHRAEPLAVLAWLAWWTGEAVRARLLSAQILDERPEHRMGRVVDALLAMNVPPPWTAAARGLPVVDLPVLAAAPGPGAAAADG